ncbi:hypothetical protein AXY43_26235 [Clostridium sp. MF28]|uniref:UvrD-helicase domain-containing protein n=1 Tax=Clostridium TaxID=1485 RepID=UPI000D2248E2|nr:MULTISPECIES: UvrD-helicase domain-containing protein [Clostridium]AVK51231.1 hypothetical protein AXY43_26235 [Clostridium sp. MF28]
MLKNNLSMDINVTEEDIEYAEKLLLKNEDKFDKEERLPIIINFQESFDVNACPGSGKTTVLLAKLIILARKLPLNNGQGVCVLTHTNVAINEIKTRLGDKSDILFKYPNFFGTIQQFIDKYLAIPFLKKLTCANVGSIDDDIYFDIIKRLSTGNFPLIKRAIQFCIGKGLYPNGDFSNNFIRFISNKHIKYVNGELFIANDTGATLESKGYYNELKDIMVDKLLMKGYLRYEDTITLAQEYLSRHENLKIYFSKRFKYVFIDEMQDTKKDQQEIFKSIFNQNSIVLQRFGDFNQSIGEGEGKDQCGWEPNSNTMLINSSKRYGDELIKFLSPLRILKSGEMEGNKKIKTINPNIIIFDDSNVNLVIETFYKILNKYGIECNYGEKIKVIGKIGIQVNDPYLSIKTYVPTYDKSNRSYPLNIKKCIKLKQSKNLYEFYNNLISILILVLIKDRNKISKDEFIKFIEMNYYELFIKYKAKMIEWYKNININSSKVFLQIAKESTEFLNKITEIEFDESKLNNFLTYDDNTSKEEAAVTKENKANAGESDISTVFGAKGEKHLATLYLESNYKTSWGDRSDISRILDYMLNKKTSVEQSDKEALSNAYVALSRAQKLTCIAIHYNTIKERIKEFEEYGYIINGCDESIEALINNEVNHPIL